MRVNVKPLVHWAIYKGYTLRFQTRTPQRVTGLLTRPDGPAVFVYDPHVRTIQIEPRGAPDFADAADAADPPSAPEPLIHINEYGWEVEP